MKSNDKYFITSYDQVQMVLDFQIFLLRVSSDNETEVKEYIQVYAFGNEGGAEHSLDSFELVGEYSELYNNRREITEQVYNYLKIILTRIQDDIENLSRSLRIFDIKDTLFDYSASDIYLYTGDEIYVNPHSMQDYLEAKETEFDNLSPLTSNPVNNPRNLFWNFRKHPSFTIEYSNDMRFIESDMGIDFDQEKYIRKSIHGRYLCKNDGELLLLAIYGYYNRIINKVFDLYFYGLFYDNGRKKDSIEIK